MELEIRSECSVCDAKRWPESNEVTGSLHKGDRVQYSGHVVGGMLRVTDGDSRDVIVHPAATSIDE